MTISSVETIILILLLKLHEEIMACNVFFSRIQVVKTLVHFFIFDKPYRLIRSAPGGTHLVRGLARKRTTLYDPSLEYLPTIVKSWPIICYSSPCKPLGPKPKPRLAETYTLMYYLELYFNDSPKNKNKRVRVSCFTNKLLKFLKNEKNVKVNLNYFLNHT